MKFFPDLNSRSDADLLVFPCFEGDKRVVDCPQASIALKSGDFKGKNGETLLLYVEGKKEPRVLLLGLGKSLTQETIRRAMAAAVRLAKQKQYKSVNFVFPAIGKIKHAVRAFLEGILLTNYSFTQLKSAPIDDPIEKIGIIGLDGKEEAKQVEIICSAVCWVRDLVNSNSDDKPPEHIAKIVEALAKKSDKLKVKVLGLAEIKKEKMGLILAVNRSSAHEPRLVQLSYRGNPKSKEHTILVGKGITYDTGGLSLKPTDGMLTMKSDMSGAATVLAAVHAAAELGLKVNVTALTPLTENVIGSKSYKPGDVYRAHNGKTVEITNTDAEGRLVLGDALSYAVKYLKPTCLVDVASLTGAVIIGIGDDIAGLFTQEDKLAAQLEKASEETSELLYRLPMNEDYRELLKSDVADMVNSAGREAGAIKAAFFLREFVADIRWAHIDFAGPCFLDKPKYYNTTKATGYGVRLLVKFLEML